MFIFNSFQSCALRIGVLDIISLCTQFLKTFNPIEEVHRVYFLLNLRAFNNNLLYLARVTPLKRHDLVFALAVGNILHQFFDKLN